MMAMTLLCCMLDSLQSRRFVVYYAHKKNIWIPSASGTSHNAAVYNTNLENIYFKASAMRLCIDTYDFRELCRDCILYWDSRVKGLRAVRHNLYSSIFC